MDRAIDISVTNSYSSSLIMLPDTFNVSNFETTTFIFFLYSAYFCLVGLVIACQKVICKEREICN